MGCGMINQGGLETVEEEEFQKIFIKDVLDLNTNWLLT